METRDPEPVRPGVELERGHGERIDVDAGRLGGTGPHGRDRHEAGAGPEIQDAPPGDGLRVVAQVRREGEPAAPGERPVRQGGVRVVGLDLDRVPQRQHLVGEMEPKVLDAGYRPKARVTKDERARRVGLHWAAAASSASVRGSATPP